MSCSSSSSPPGGFTRRHDQSAKLAWVTQQARNLPITGRLKDKHILLRDRDAKFSGSFDEVLRTEGLTVVKTPVRAPRANAFAERWVGTARRGGLGHILVVGRRGLQRLLACRGSRTTMPGQTADW